MGEFVTPVVTQIRGINYVLERKMKMSRKNHKMVEGRLLQMDKKFSALKEKQKKKLRNGFMKYTVSVIWSLVKYRANGIMKRF